MIPGRRILVTGASRSGIETKISPAHPAQLVRRAMRHERWALGLVDQSVESIARHGITGAIRWLVNDNRWVFLADPFCYVLPDGRMVILAERLNYWTDRGEIWAAVIPANGDAVKAQFRPWLVANFHLSYPFLFADGGTQYLICESWEAGGLFLWKNNGAWNVVGKILDCPAVDATIWRGPDCWWLFCGIVGDRENARLHIFFADRPEGPWYAHPCNPVKSDIATSRPAGPLFVCGDMIIRPAQDCSQAYGSAINLNVMTALTRTTYHEYAWRKLEPDTRYPEGLHTICQAGSMTMIDGKCWDAHPFDIARRLITPVQRHIRRRRTPAWPAQLPSF